MAGFRVPGSLAGSYVASQRNEDGGYAYDTAANQIGIQKQAALQDLSEQYASTINNAYQSYLSSQRGLNTSNLTQGYKEAYQAAQDKALQQNVNTVLSETQQARQQIETNAASAQQQLQTQYEQDVSNLDTAINKMSAYADYLYSLNPDKEGNTFLSEDEYGLKSTDKYDLYNYIAEAQPRNYTDAEGNMGQSFSEYTRSQLSDSEADTAWSNWFYNQGGYNQLREAIQKNKKYSSMDDALLEVAKADFNKNENKDTWAKLQKKLGTGLEDSGYYDIYKRYGADTEEELITLRGIETLEKLVSYKMERDSYNVRRPLLNVLQQLREGYVQNKTIDTNLLNKLKNITGDEVRDKNARAALNVIGTYRQKYGEHGYNEQDADDAIKLLERLGIRTKK